MEEDSLIAVSALNQFLFCPRRCWLIHGEGVFTDNAYTLEGNFLHDRADTPGVEERDGVRIVRALPLYSRRLGLTGKADIVEFHKNAGGPETPYPVDYKRGRRKKWVNDDVQLCAQGLCLEEMLSVTVPGGAIYHAASKRRREVPFTSELRIQTCETIDAVRSLLASGHAPVAVLLPKCEGCSLKGACMPEISSQAHRAAQYCRTLFTRTL